MGIYGISFQGLISIALIYIIYIYNMISRTQIKRKNQHYCHFWTKYCILPCQMEQWLSLHIPQINL